VCEAHAGERKIVESWLWRSVYQIVPCLLASNVFDLEHLVL